MSGEEGSSTAREEIEEEATGGELDLMYGDEMFEEEEEEGEDTGNGMRAAADENLSAEEAVEGEETEVSGEVEDKMEEIIT